MFVLLNRFYFLMAALRVLRHWQACGVNTIKVPAWQGPGVAVLSLIVAVVVTDVAIKRPFNFTGRATEMEIIGDHRRSSEIIGDLSHRCHHHGVIMTVTWSTRTFPVL